MLEIWRPKCQLCHSYLVNIWRTVLATGNSSIKKIQDVPSVNHGVADEETSRDGENSTSSTLQAQTRWPNASFTPAPKPTAKIQPVNDYCQPTREDRRMIDDGTWKGTVSHLDSDQTLISSSRSIKHAHVPPLASQRIMQSFPFEYTSPGAN